MKTKSTFIGLIVAMMLPVLCEAQVVTDTIYDSEHAYRVTKYIDGVLHSKQSHEIIMDARRKEPNDRLMSETLFNEDGSVQEELVLTYRRTKKGEKKYYDRKCFYPSGALRYQETTSEEEEGMKTVYYTEKGKVDRRPKEKIAPYMEMPEFPGGQEALFAFLNKTVKYPKEAKENQIQGKVIVQFVVDKDGSVEDVQVVRSGGHPLLDEEAVRVAKNMPRWIPGKLRGEPIRVQYRFPVNFKLK